MADDRHVALVTGAGRNIGRACALALASAGCRVIVHARENEAEAQAVASEVRAIGPGAAVVLGDLGDRDAVSRVTDEALAAFGHVDVLVNNAAIRPAKPFLELTGDEWHRVLAVDLHAAFHTCQACLPGMVERRWGRIVNLTGMNAIHGYRGRAPVSVAKHGLWGLTKALAKEFGPHGITVNAVSPGPIGTERHDPEMARHIESQRSLVPLGRLGRPEEIAALVAFLASEAGGFVSGQMIAANGGAQT